MTIFIHPLDFHVSPVFAGLRCLAILLGRVEDKDCATLCVPLPRSPSVGRGAGGSSKAAKEGRGEWPLSAGGGVFISQTFLLGLLSRCGQGEPIQCG